jgi:eukaryotic-like serine/threonine-protein kinase
VLRGTSSITPRRSVAVLGFRNLSENPQEAWLSTALSDWLVTELTAGEQLRAIPAETVARMKMELSLPDVDSLSQTSLIRIRKNLSTDFVVVGSYLVLGQSSNGQIRLDLRLQDTQSGETLAGVSEVGTKARLLDVVSSAGQHLREKLGIRAITREEAAEVAIALPSTGPTTRLYSEGLAKLRVFDALAARDLLLKAVAAEPSFALSHAALATAWAQLGYDRNAQAEAKKAFDLSANLPRAERLLAEGRYREMSRDWPKAIEIYRALFDFFPDNLEYGLALANAEVAANQWKQGLDTIAALRSLPAPLGDDPRIDFAENAAARSLGDTQRAEAALARAAEKAKSAGASLLLARTRREQAWLFENSGKEEQVEPAIEESKRLCLAANDQLGVAQSATLEGITLERQGDYLSAKGKYEEALSIHKSRGAKLGMGSQYDNLGDIFLYLGDLTSAREQYQNALAIYEEVGDQDGVALAKLGIGDALFAAGKHVQAKELYEEALHICRANGDRSRQAAALSALARVLRIEGDSESARKNNGEALALFESVGDKSEAEHVRIQLATILLDEGNIAAAADMGAQAVRAFAAIKSGRYQAEAELILSQALLNQGRWDEARKNIEHALALGKNSHSPELEFRAEIATARLQALSGDPSELPECFRRLNRLVNDAAASSFENVAFEARLVLGELELRAGNSSLGRMRLAALEKDCIKSGTLLIARNASSALRAASASLAN